MVHRALAAADVLAKDGIDVEVIDVRCLAPLDMDTISASVRQTNRVLIVEEDNRTGGWGAEIAARIGEDLFYHLDAPVARLAGPDTPVPCCETLERVHVPQVDDVVREVRRLTEQ